MRLFLVSLVIGFMLLFGGTGVVKAQSWTVGVGGDSWSGNVVHDDTTEVQATGKIELRQLVDDYISYWKFDEGSGLTAYDEHKTNNNDGVLTNIDPATGWVSGKYGKALDFDGSDDYLNNGNNESLDLIDEITIEAWIKSAAGLANSYLVLKDDQISKRCWDLKVSTDLKFAWLIWDSGSVMRSCYADNVLSYNTWYHVAGTYDGSMQRIYVDGVLQTNTNLWSNTIKSELTQPVIVSGNFLKEPSNTLRHSDDAQVTSYSATYEKKKTITFDNVIKGTLRVKFDLRRFEAGAVPIGRVYKNGVPIGFEQWGDGAWATFIEDIDVGFMAPGETLELWLRQIGDCDSTARNFRIYYDSASCFKGTIDEVRIYNRALTSAEINQTMNNEHYASGNLASINKDAEGIGYAGDVWKQIKFAGTIPVDTNVSIYMNSSSDNLTWNDWTLVKANAISGIAYELPERNQKRYAKWKLVLNTNDLSVSPEVEKMMLVAGQGGFSTLPNRIAVFPNPYRADDKSCPKKITFANLPEEATIRIYTLSGELVKTIKHKDIADGGSEEWDISGISSGVYMYEIISPANKEMGKLSIMK
jgi:hypothetical protein